MENASKALLIAGAILLCILIIAIGMFIYNSAQRTITDSLTNLSTQEIEAFNNQFLIYEGVQKGTNVKNLIGKLIANANTNANEPSKMPYVMRCIGNNNWGSTAQQDRPGNPQKYIDACGKFKNEIKANLEYNIIISYQKNGLIDIIHICDKDMKLNVLWHRLRPVYKTK